MIFEIKPQMRLRTKINEIWYESIAVQYTDWGSGPMWWVETTIQGNRNVDLFKESDLLEWNTNSTCEIEDYSCDCGAQAIGHPGHSLWCSSMKEPIDFDEYDLDWG